MKQVFPIALLIILVSCNNTYSPMDGYVEAVKRQYDDSVKRVKAWQALPKKLLTATKDDRGFTTVIFTEGVDTFGLDFLTPVELDSFKKAEGFK